MDAEVAKVLDPRAQPAFRFALHRALQFRLERLSVLRLSAPTTKVTRPWLISSCATRQAFMLLVGISGCAPDCNWRALRAAPFTRLYLLWRGSSFDIVRTSGMLSIYPTAPHLSRPAARG
jgi:hypothetical protein